MGPEPWHSEREGPVGTGGVGRRVVAALIDTLMIAALFVAIGVISGNAYSRAGSVGVSLEGVTALIFFALTVAYYLVPEALLQVTLGKALLGLRVVTANGGRPRTGSIVARTLLRLVDGLPVLYLVGFLVMLATRGRRQRIGDLVAGTFVVVGSRQPR